MFLDDSSSARYLSTTLGCSFADCRLAVAEVTGAPGRTPMRTPSRSPLISWAVQALSGWLRRLLAHSSTTSGVCTLHAEGGRVACSGAPGSCCRCRKCAAILGATLVHLGRCVGPK